jgi:hypothetical protein
MQSKPKLRKVALSRALEAEAQAGHLFALGFKPSAFSLHYILM